MTELRPIEQYRVKSPEGGQAAGPSLPPDIAAYYEEKRRALITELRAVDRLLGRPPTIPERGRVR